MDSHHKGFDKSSVFPPSIPNPYSMITRQLMLFKYTKLFICRSLSLPGVAMMISTPFNKSFICPSRSPPPYTQTLKKIQRFIFRQGIFHHNSKSQLKHFEYKIEKQQYSITGSFLNYPHPSTHRDVFYEGPCSHPCYLT